MTVLEMLKSVGLDPSIMMAGGLGGLFRSLSGRDLKLRERIVSPVCGALCAGYLTAAVVHYLRTVGIPLPPSDLAALGAVGFVVGTVGMWVADAAQERVARWIKSRPA